MKFMSILGGVVMLDAACFAEEGSEFGVEEHMNTDGNEQVIEQRQKITSQFYDDLAVVEAKYRAAKAEMMLEADRVEVYLVSFDGKVSSDPFSAETEFEVDVESVNGAKILQKKELSEELRAALLKVLAGRIAAPKHTGGAFCHFPIHGVKVYAGDQLLHEGTFCWVCGNFSFNYPQGSSWLDTNAELKEFFMEQLPIPESELQRFYDKYPGARPKKETATGSSKTP